MGKKDKENKPLEEEVQDTKEVSQEEVQTEIPEEDEMQAKYDDLNNRYLRLYSEFDNFRRRTAKEKIDLISNASASVMTDLLSVLDDFERAIKHNEESNESDSIKQGFELIYSKFYKILENKGLKPMESIGEPFDTELHEAIANVPAEKDQKGKVIDVTVKGYFLNDNVLRHAQVVVGQ